jgi:hypothetical protein
MITYITWSKDIDAAFRAFYPTIALEGETIADYAQKLDANKQPIIIVTSIDSDTAALEAEAELNAAYYMVGTSRLDSAGQVALIAAFGDAISFEEGN